MQVFRWQRPVQTVTVGAWRRLGVERRECQQQNDSGEQTHPAWRQQCNTAAPQSVALQSDGGLMRATPLLKGPRGSPAPHPGEMVLFDPTATG